MKSVVALYGIVICSVLFALSIRAADGPAPVPRLQALPLPYQQVGFERDGQEIARYHFGLNMRRPFVYPVIGPAGRSLTRMGHPRDPESHSHHYSVWISHNDVNGVSFWADNSVGRIVHQRVESFEDRGEASWVVVVNHWLNESNHQVLLAERRATQVQLLPRQEWLLILDLQFEAALPEVTLGKTPFGLIGVRMAKSLGVHDGAGTIRNSEGAEDEPAIFWKKARWVDYSGSITAQAVEGLTLMDHPGNPNHPTAFHVRRDGWMGSSLTLEAPLVIRRGTPLKVRYGVYVHAGKPALADLQKVWEQFAKTEPLNLAPKP